MSRVLITGANGFFGAHLVKQALDNGFIVRGVVRSEDKAAQIKKTFPSEKFETAVVPDVITGDFTEALKGVNAVIHAASPFFLAEKLDDPEKEFLEPAVNGTLNVLRATHKAGIKRFISTATIGNVISKPNMMNEADTTYGPDDWFPAPYEMGASGQAPPFVVYLISKKYAELAVWDFGKEHPEMQLTVVLPTIIYGPMIHPISSMKNINASNAIIYALLNGILYPDSVPIFCDAVSAAKVHIKALQSDSTIGKRVLFAKGPGTMYQILQIIKENRPELASRLPATPEAGDPLGGKPFVNIDSSIATKELGVSGLDLKETILQTVDDLLRLEKELGTN